MVKENYIARRRDALSNIGTNIKRQKKDKWEGTTHLRNDGRCETRICIHVITKSFYGKTEA